MSWKRFVLSFLKERDDFDETENTKAERSGRLAQSVAFSLLAIGLVIALAYALRSVLTPVIFAVIFSVILFPLAQLFERCGFNRVMASLTAVVLGVLAFLGLSYLLVNATINISQDASSIADKIETVLKSGENWMNEKFDVSRTEIISRGKEELNKSVSGIGSFVSKLFGSVGSFLSIAVLVPLMIFFFLYYRDFFREFFVRAFYSSPREKVEITLTKIYEALKNYLGGMLIVMAIIAVLNTVGLMILGIEYAWFFGILASLLMLIPYIGIAIGCIMPALFALATKDSYWYAVGVVAWFQFVQFLEANFITPNIVGGKISLNPLVSILSLFLFSLLFGFTGLILALPLMAILKVIFDAVDELKPYGFLLGEPKKKYLWTDRQRRKKPIKIKREEAKEEIERKKEGI